MKGHFAASCKSLHRCRKCQKPHHTLLHTEGQQRSEQSTPLPAAGDVIPNEVSSNTAVKLRSNSLLMTCQVLIVAPNGSSIKAQALLDNGSSASFISERLVQSIHLPCARQQLNISGIGGATPNHSIKSVTSFKITPITSKEKSIDIYNSHGYSQSDLQSANTSHPHLTHSGITSRTWPWPILNLVCQVVLMSYLVLMCLLKHCIMAGGKALQDHLLHWKLCLVGYFLETQSKIFFILLRLLLTILWLKQGMTFCESFGK